MNPGQYNFTCPKGTTFSKSVTYKVNKFAVNLTGYSARMQVRETLASTSTLVSLSSPSNGMTVNSAGVITMTISAATTAGFANGTYVYDLEIESAGGVVTRLLEGKFKVTGEVTR
jgi:hypothetical protein